MRVILALVLALSAVSWAVNGDMGNGDGSEGNPYLIEDLADFQAFADPNNAATYWAGGVHTKLMTDIDLSGKTISPIGNAGAYFKGGFNGNYHTISHLTISSSIQEHVGLFGIVCPMGEPGTLKCFIKNLGLINPAISTTYESYDGACAGTLVGNVRSYDDNPVTIENCYVTGGSVEGYGNVGGLIGYAGCDIIQCYTDISVSGEYTVGGLVGHGGQGTHIDQCYSLGDVSGTSIVGGLAGNLSYKYEGVVSNCYAQGDVHGNSDVGGFAGQNNSMNIVNSYSTGYVSGNHDPVGGFAGTSTDIMNCYWDVETSGQVNSSVGEGKTTAEMMSMATFVGWDCCGVWTIQAGADYPHLAWEGLPGEPFPQETYSGGSGTPSDPYLISTAQQLHAIGQRYCHLDQSFRLIADIDMRDLAEGDFEPIGSIYPFMGTFDGDGHSILNLQYLLHTDLLGQNGGLFASVGSRYIPSRFTPEIHDLIFIDPNVAVVYTGSNPDSFCYVGSLAGKVINAMIHDVNVINADISSIAGTAGGVVGLIENLESNYLISNINCSGCVTASNSVGGIAGNCNYVELVDSNFSGHVSGNNNVGGLIGWFRGNIDQCTTKGDINGTSTVGGLVGKTDGTSMIENSYSHCNLEGTDNVGGFCGTNYLTGITNCYSTGRVIGSGERIGGFIGYHNLGYQNKYPSRFEACFWNTETSGTTDGIGSQSPDPTGVTGKTTAEMMTQSTFTGWDFVDDWMMLREGEDYPRLAWQAVFGGDIAGLYGVDMVDFSYLANYWGLTECDSGTDCGRADIDESGDVGIGDLSRVAEDWLRGIF